MTKEEKKEVMDYINSLYNRVNCAKTCIREMNFGKAESILAEPFPKLNIKVTE